MLLETILSSNREDVFIYLERKVNARFPLGGEFADVPEEYRADIGAPSYKLPYSKLKTDEVKIFNSGVCNEVKEEIINGGEVKFFVHPVMIPDYLGKKMNRILEFNGELKVSQTSSTRTVMTKTKDKNFMLKVNLERRLGESIRKLRSDQIEHSYKIMKEIQGADLPEKFSYMPESLGILYSQEEGEAGMIVREFEPHPKTGEKRFVFPFFSLFSIDKANKEHDPLLAQLVERDAKRENTDEFEIFSNKIVEPLISTWAYFVKRGLNPDIHAQNLLLEVDGVGSPKRIVYRDFQEFFVNPRLREKLGFNGDFNRHRVHNEKRHYSFTYDFRIARMLDFFSIVLKKYESCTEKKITEFSKKVFDKELGEFKEEIFPEKAYYVTPGQHMGDSFECEILETKYR